MCAVAVSVLLQGFWCYVFVRACSLPVLKLRIDRQNALSGILFRNTLHHEYSHGSGDSAVPGVQRVPKL